ncbi:MAG: glycosyltransferase family 4 protein [Pirellulales bacterium]|nr:glycosyltransferase family 4 protein [Pirellulales bacterium]
MPSLRILNASQNYFIRGGSDRYFFTLTELLERHGHTVIPFSSRQPRNEPTAWQRYFPPGVSFDAPGPRDLARFVYSRAAADALTRLLADHPVDVAHLHIYYGQLTGSILPVLRAAGVPIVQTVHDFKVVCPVYSLLSHGEICEACRGHQFWRATVKRCNRGSLKRSLLSTVESYVTRALGAVDAVDRFIAVSDFQRDKLIELGVPADKLTTIRNFADTTGVEPVREPGEYLLYFGRIERLKGVIALVEAAARAREVPLLLVGRGEAEAEVRDLIIAHGLTNVQLLGFKQGAELKRLIRGAIATLIPSEGYDNCPLAVLESYTHAKPVLGTRMGGIPELIDNGRDGFLVSPGDIEALGERLAWFNAHRREAVELGLAGRDKIERRFNPEVHYEQVRDVYRQVRADQLAELRERRAVMNSAVDSAIDDNQLCEPLEVA